MVAREHARALLASLGLDLALGTADDPARAWAASGGQALTAGRAHAGPAVAIQGALLALQALAPQAPLPDVGLLGERAALSGFTAGGAISCGGATRLLGCADGLVALALPRDDDLALVPALVGADVPPGWAAVRRWAADLPAGQVRDRAALLGLACSVPGEVAPASVPWHLTPLTATPVRARPRVLDLSSLWAGPLCGSLLAAAGCDVVKVEDPARPDGARQGPPALYDLLNAGKSRAAWQDLPGLLGGADVVIEASRPRALQQRGIQAEEFHGVWISITGYGRDQPHRIGFGDDAAVAGGLLADPPGFVADAVADPLTGVHAAVAALGLLRQGRGALVDVPLSRCAAAAAACAVPAGDLPASPPRARTPVGPRQALA